MHLPVQQLRAVRQSPTDDRQGWPESAAVLHISGREDICHALGPDEPMGLISVQGCPFRCPGCQKGETLPFWGGTAEPVEKLATHFAGLTQVKGVTFTGGEPTSQAAPLARFMDVARSLRPDFSFVSYTGYTLERLLEVATPSQLAFLARLDLLIDGPYDRTRHTDLRLRGSDNQRLLFLTDRYRHLREQGVESQRGTWVDLSVSPTGAPHVMGIVPPGFRRRFERRLAALGVDLRV